MVCGVVDADAGADGVACGADGAAAGDLRHDSGRRKDYGTACARHHGLGGLVLAHHDWHHVAHDRLTPSQHQTVSKPWLCLLHS